ncbi:MAG TPA: HPF/RaiA family ribosome-associated protein [Vicinamibacterales bacterium]|nr:HPF/RaiA family ribosome-associated protein [Vicinamibacterales bacterium]
MVHFGEDSSIPVTVTTGADVPAAVAERARRRVQFALDRFSSRVRAVRVRITDINGPRGGIDKQCIVAVRLQHPTRLMLIEHIAADFGEAVDRAADRAGRSVARVARALAAWTPSRS